MRAASARRSASRCIGSASPAEYRERVFAHFLSEYAAGRTPNPDVLCNREIKFGVCLDYMRRLGAALHRHRPLCAPRAGARRPGAAQGARRVQGPELFPARRRARGARAAPCFRSASCARTRCAQRAHAAGLPVHDKPDSTGICFIGERPFAGFPEPLSARSPGAHRDPGRPRLGEHRGLAFYTLGQRSGLRLGGRAARPPRPGTSPTRIASRNALIVVQDHDHPLLMSDGFDGRGLALAVRRRAAGAFECAVKTRYRQADLRVPRARRRPDGRGAGRVAATRARRDAGPVRGILRRTIAASAAA